MRQATSHPPPPPSWRGTAHPPHPYGAQLTRGPTSWDERLPTASAMR